MEQRLTRDTRRGVLGGVAAGIGNYFEVDPVLVRIVFIALAALSGAGLIAYVVGWIIMPRGDAAAHEVAAAPSGSVPPQAPPVADPSRPAAAATVDRIVDEVRRAGDRLSDEFHRMPRDTGRGRVIGGVTLIVLGAFFLLDRLYIWHWPHWARLGNLWPIILIAAGASLIMEAARGGGRERVRRGEQEGA